jgi:hemolysin activation/secretion protein
MRFARIQFFLFSAIAILLGFESLIEHSTVLAQSLVRPSNLIPPASPKLPETLPNLLPSTEELLKPSQPNIPVKPEISPTDKTFVVQEFRIVGSTVFSTEELGALARPFTNRPISFTELLEVRAAIANLYITNGYITSGAFIPPQETDSGLVTIQVIEGKLEDIQISGTNRLNPEYVRSRLGIATNAPVSRDRLLNALQLLQLNPLFSSVSAELKAGTQLGTNVLSVVVVEANSFNLRLSLDNSAPANVGQLLRQVEVSDRNLFGFGDRLAVTYGNTDGRNLYNLNYSIPLNPYNGTLSLGFNNTNSNIIDPEFKSLDIFANSTVYDLTLRQPLLQTAAQEFALGLTASYGDSFTTLLKLPIPLSAGADRNGRTKISAVRFFQDYTQRSSEDVLALRSQVSLGLGGLLNSTINDNAPDSRFVSWRGQFQYVRSLATDTLLLVNAGLQFADRPLPASEQFGLGGFLNGRGYRQDALVGDNGANASVEARFPILRIPEIQGLLQIAPFIDLGVTWNQSGNQFGNQPSAANGNGSWLLGTGLGLRWQMGERLNARLDYGIPIVPAKGNRNSWQENGIYFSLTYSLF